MFIRGRDRSYTTVFESPCIARRTQIVRPGGDVEGDVAPLPENGRAQTTLLQRGGMVVPAFQIRMRMTYQGIWVLSSSAGDRRQPLHSSRPSLAPGRRIQREPHVPVVKLECLDELPNFHVIWTVEPLDHVIRCRRQINLVDSDMKDRYRCPTGIFPGFPSVQLDSSLGSIKGGGPHRAGLDWTQNLGLKR